MESKELASVSIVERGVVVKSWRMKGCGEHMPWFAERLMRAVERYTEGFNSDVDAVLVDMGIDSDWVICISSPVIDTKAIIEIGRTAIDETPDIKVTVRGGNSSISIADCDIDDCFSVAVECMKCLDELV